MQHIYNSYLSNYLCGASNSSNSIIPLFSASNRTANTSSSLNISLSNDLNPYLQQTLNKLPVALNSNIPYLQHSMIAFTNRIPYQTIPEAQNNSNLIESLDSIGSDSKLDQNRPDEEELNSGSNGNLSEGQSNPTDSTELSFFGTSNISSSISDAYPASQTSPSSIRTADEKHLTGVVKTTVSDSSVQRPLQTKKEKSIKAIKNRLSGSSTHGGGVSSSCSSGVSAQELDKAMSLTNNGFRNMSLKGIYYDRRNHGWQVRIRKRQTEISRYFSAKRYGVEKSYEMALRFYQVNIIGNLNNELRSVNNSETSHALDGNSDVQTPSMTPKDGQHELHEHQKSRQKNFEGHIVNNNQSLHVASGNSAVESNNIQTNTIRSNSTDGLFRSLNIDSTSFNENLSRFLSYPAQGDLDVNNQLISHYITNNILNNILVNQIIANNLFANTMINVRNAVNLNGTGNPIHCFSKIMTPQTPVQQYGSGLSTCINSPNIVPSTPIVSPGIGVVSYDSQLMLKDIISNALSESESLWKGIYYDNRNNGWIFCLDGHEEKFFGSTEFGEAESLALAFSCKINALKLSCDTSQICSIISNNVSDLQKIMAISNETFQNSPSSDDESSVEKGHKKTIKSFMDLTLHEKMDNCSLNELNEFISISQQIKQVINNSILKSGHQVLAGINFNHGISMGQPVSLDLLKQNFNVRQPILSNFSDNSFFFQNINNNQSLLHGQCLLNNQNQFGIL